MKLLAAELRGIYLPLKQANLPIVKFFIFFFDLFSHLLIAAELLGIEPQAIKKILRVIL